MIVVIMFAKQSHTVDGHVVVEEREGVAHVHVVCSRRVHTTGHDSGVHDHAHSAVAPSHALEWGGYAGSVVTNSNLTSGSQGIVAADAADDDAPATTTSDLAKMTLVELLSRILGLRPLSPTDFEIAQAPSVTCVESVGWQGYGHQRGRVSIVLLVPAPVVVRGSWSDNKAPERADGLRLFTATNNGDPGPPLAESAAAFAVSADPRILPFGSREKETLMFDATEMSALLYGDITSVISQTTLGGHWFAVRKSAAGLGLILVDSDGNDTNVFTAVLDPIRYFNEDEPPPASDNVVADGTGFRRVYEYSHQSIEVEGSLGMPLGLGATADFSVGEIDTPGVAAYSDIEGTSRTVVSNDVSTDYTDIDMSGTITTGGLQVLFDEIAVGSGTSNVRRLVSATADGESIDISNTQYISGTNGAAKLVVEVPLQISGSTISDTSVSTISGTTRAVSLTVKFGMEYPEIILQYALRAEQVQQQEDGSVLVVGPLLQIPRYPALHVSMFEVIGGVTSTTTWQRTFSVVVVNTADQRHDAGGGALVRYSGGKAFVDRRGLAIVSVSDDDVVKRYHAGAATISGNLVLRVIRVFSMVSVQADGTTKEAPLILDGTIPVTSVTRTDVNTMPFGFKGWLPPGSAAYAHDPLGTWDVGGTEPAFGKAIDLNRVEWQYYLKNEYGGGELGDSGAVISEADASAYWNQSECIRYGFTFGMAAGGSEDIAVPMHHIVDRRDGSTYTGVSNLGRCDVDVANSSDYDRASAEALSIADVQDVGSGLLNAVTGMGFIIKNTFVHACRLDIMRNAATGDWQDVNRIDAVLSEALPQLWEVSYGVVFDIHITKNGYAGSTPPHVRIRQHRTDGHDTLYDTDVPEGGHFVFVIRKVAWRQYRMIAGTTNAEGTYTSIDTAADFDPSQGPVMAGDGSKEYAKISPSTIYVNSHHQQTEDRSGGIWFRILATGVRAWQRYAMRKASALSTPPSSGPPSSGDFAEVTKFAEFIEWPTNTAIMGHDAGAWLEIRGRGGGGGSGRSESEDLKVLSAIGLFELDNYRRYFFNPLHITTSHPNTFAWKPKGTSYQGFRFLAKGNSHADFLTYVDDVYTPEDGWGDSEFEPD